MAFLAEPFRAAGAAARFWAFATGRTLVFPWFLSAAAFSFLFAAAFGVAFALWVVEVVTFSATLGGATFAGFITTLLAEAAWG